MDPTVGRDDRRPLGALLLAGCLLFAGCAPSPFEATRQRALRYFATQVEGSQPSWAPIFDYLHRRFGLEAVDARGRPLHLPPPGRPEGEIAAIYHRAWDPAAAVRKEQIAALESPIDRISASALHCDRIALPVEWEAILGEASRVGGYALTHAVLAGQWTIENGCRSQNELADLQNDQVALLEQLAGQREETIAAFDAGQDIWIETLAMLYYLGADDRVRDEWLDALVAAQRSDGGWARGRREDRSDPHPTSLSLWVLLERLEPDRPRVPWLSSR
jgi:hypothetical protein